MSAVAEREGISVQYVGKLFRVLAKADLVVSVRGCKGGYRLARRPQEISIGEILAALGGKIYEPSVCERYIGDRRFCVHNNDCSIRSLWSGLQLIVETILSGTTLRDLVGSEGSVGQWMRKNLNAVAELVDTLDTVGDTATRARVGSESGDSVEGLGATATLGLQRPLSAVVTPADEVRVLSRHGDAEADTRTMDVKLRGKIDGVESRDVDR